MKLADIKSNRDMPTGEFQAGRAPMATDDATAGFVVGCTWVDATADKAYICVDDSVGAAIWKDVTASGSGEANTSSNIGTAGVGVYHSKSGVDLRFKKINAGSARTSITDDTNNNEVDIDVVEASVVHQNLSGAGSNTHANIDSHIASTSNPHSTTADQVLPSQTGNGGKYLTTNGTSSSWGAVAGGTNTLLDGSNHTDTAAGVVARGDIITGQGATPKWTRLPKGAANQVLAMDGTATDAVWTTLASAPPPWKGAIVGATGDGNPNSVLQSIQSDGVVSPTPTNITTSVARIAYFQLDTAIVVNKIRWYGVGATTNVYRVAIYRNSDSARLTTELAFTTAANTWGNVAAGGITLSANVLYFVAVSVNATGTTAGLLALSPTVAATTGQIAVVPTAWPGNLDIDLVSPLVSPFAFAQFAVTTGALPATAPTRAAQAAWTGGMPAFFLDNNNA